MLDDQIPEELFNEQISVAPSLYTHSSIIQDIQNKMIQQSSKIQNDPDILKTSLTNDIFKEDNLDISQFDPNNPKYKSKPHEVLFQVNSFIKYTIFSLLYTILGPLIIPIFIWTHKQLLYNFQLFGLKWTCLFTYLRYSLDMALVIGFIYHPMTQFQLQLLLYFVVQIFSELVVQNLMLAFYHPQKIELLEKFPLEVILNKFENQINPLLWCQQSPELIQFELEQSIRRLHIEPGLFIFFFIVQPNEKRREKISHKFENLKVEGKYAGNGIKMAIEIIQYYNESSPLYMYVIVACGFTIIRLCITVTYSFFQHAAPMQTIMFVAITALNTIGYFIVITIILITFRDLQRKVFCLNQLSHLISAQQVEEYDETKIFPTLNFLCVQSLFSWQNLRKVILDYGLQYYQRENAIISFCLEIILVLVLFALLNMFNVISCYSLGDESKFSLFILISFDVLTIMFLSILVVLQGARINKHFQIHQTMLKKNMFTYQQLSTQSFIKKEYHVQPQDFMFKTLKSILDRIQLGDENKNWFFLYSQYVLNAIDQAYSDLCYEEENKPFTVLGIAMTYSLAFQLIASFLGILGTIIISLYFNVDL
ncbi:unnamed protein product (macronuclear) [Paramecium tetraurelia]|uniref:Transmembrane protein n=1 Tax=Paramecium tetraurelia TaxID=5888 RepID=A0E9M2_PARTE|nr:uncharacterized protein GSPATT00024720001 [Paramecium tetraurelia]CAK91989.1 unnamed protein product [Paramecium tetraurelia]|eukprot:XP_001459386.1 hypothetical protein (macronuclear) [Paramecium tetraurelia strain d4-2]